MTSPRRADIYDPSTLEEVCDRLVEGQSMNEICRDPTMPSSQSVYRAMSRDEHVYREISRARAIGQDARVDKMSDIAAAVGAPDDSLPPMPVYRKDGTPLLDAAGEVVMERPSLSPEKAKIMIAVTQWTAGRLRPRVYGDKTQIEHSGTVETKTTNVLDVSSLDDDELDALERALRKTLELAEPTIGEAPDDDA